MQTYNSYWCWIILALLCWLLYDKFRGHFLYESITHERRYEDLLELCVNIILGIVGPCTFCESVTYMQMKGEICVVCITWDTLLTMISIVKRYKNLHWQPQARHKIDYLKHTRWIIKDTWRRTHNLMWFGPNLAYVLGERTWESFINKLDIKRSNISLDDTRIFAFPLNLRLNYKNIPSLYAHSPCSSLSWLFRLFLAV